MGSQDETPLPLGWWEEQLVVAPRCAYLRDAGVRGEVRECRSSRRLLQKGGGRVARRRWLWIW
jgi:hypothetical protein